MLVNAIREPTKTFFGVERRGKSPPSSTAFRPKPSITVR